MRLSFNHRNETWIKRNEPLLRYLRQVCTKSFTHDLESIGGWILLPPMRDWWWPDWPRRWI